MENPLIFFQFLSTIICRKMVSVSKISFLGFLFRASGYWEILGSIVSSGHSIFCLM